jgi:ferric-dicitrate binding protein FerR (iron transport regulator)
MNGPNELDRLLADFQAGALSESDELRLAALLSRDPATQKDFAELFQVDALLRNWVHVGDADEDHQARVLVQQIEARLTPAAPLLRSLLQSRRPRRARPWILWIAAASLLLGAIAVALRLRSGDAPSGPQRAPVAERKTRTPNEAPAPDSPDRRPAPSPERKAPEEAPKKEDVTPVAPERPRPPSDLPKPAPPEKPAPPLPPDPRPEVAIPQPPEKGPPALLESQVEVARCAWVQGDVFAIHGTERTRLKEGASLLVGRGVESAGTTSNAVLVLADGTRIDLSGKARLREIGGLAADGPDAGVRRVSLVDGRFRVAAAKQKARQSLVFHSPQADVRVIGTEFDLVVAEASTRVEVLEGKVGVLNLASHKSIDVVAGRFAVASPDGALTTAALGSDRKPVFQCHFDDGRKDDWVGSLESANGGSKRAGGFLRSVPNPSIPMTNACGIIVSPPKSVFKWDSRLRFRFEYRVSSAGHLWVQVHPLSGALSLDLPASEPKVWHTFDRSLGDFEEAMGRRLPLGDAILGFYVQGSGDRSPPVIDLDNVEIYEPLAAPSRK